MLPSIEPSEVGATGLIWLFFSYGYVLFSASNLISQGSDLLLLVPSLAGLVGGVVLPLLGAVPDGAIMLFSGMGDIATAQETLSIGVGALAGSTIMLLTIPWGLSVYGGRVNLKASPDGELKATYNTKPKLTEGLPLKEQGNMTGVVITDEIKNGSKIMILTLIPYVIIQGPASFLKGGDNIAQEEKNWALLGLIICLIGFVLYLKIQVQKSKEDEEKFHRMEVIKSLLKNGEVSLSGAFHGIIEAFDTEELENKGNDGYQSVEVSIIKESKRPSPAVEEYLSEVLKVPFQKYDKNKNAQLEKTEVRLFLSDFKENLTDEEVDELFQKYDTDGDENLSFQEFVWACYSILIAAKVIERPGGSPASAVESTFAKTAKFVATSEEGNEEEEEEMSPDIAALPAEEQEAAIKAKAFTMLAIGTSLVLLFSDPMVDVMQEIAVRVGISPFYISFILAPLASNASEVIASMYYASKKTTKSITVSFSALQGAACMNNTFCLSIFMGLIYFRGLAWQYTAETIAIIGVQVILYFLTQGSVMTLKTAFVILSIFPLSIALVASLEAIGFD